MLCKYGCDGQSKMCLVIFSAMSAKILAAFPLLSGYLPMEANGHVRNTGTLWRNTKNGVYCKYNPQGRSLARFFFQAKKVSSIWMKLTQTDC